MKIVFICGTDINFSVLGVEYISSVLKRHGYKVELLVDPIHSSDNKISYIEKENLKKLKELKPNLIGFSTVSAHYQWALKMARLIKKEMGAPIIFGGAHVTATPESVIENNVVDMVCVGEGEEAILELVGSLQKKEDRGQFQRQ